MAEIGDDDVGAAGKPYTRERRTCGRAQLRFAARVAPEAKRVTRMRLHGERHVVEDGKIEEQRGDLERPRQTKLAASVGGQRRDVAAFETDAPGVGGNLAGELADQRGLARAVRPDDGVKLALRHAKRNGVRGDDAAEALGQFLDLEQRISHGALPPAGRRYRRVQTARPAGTGVRARSANIRRCEPPHPRTRETPWPGSRSEAPPPGTATRLRR